MPLFTEFDIRSFADAADSLRKYRRAEVIDEETGESLIDALYCDPLPSMGVITRLNSSNTALIIGRKGTGKSTLFQKLQHDTRKRNDRITAYIDIKTIFESSQPDVALRERIAATPNSLSPGALEKLMLYRTFLTSVVQEIHRELDKKLSESMWERIKNAFSGKVDELKTELNGFTEYCQDDHFVRVLALKAVSIKSGSSAKSTVASSAKANATLTGTGPQVGIESGTNSSTEAANADEIQYSDLLANVFEPGKLIRRLREILERAGLRHLYLLVDDFSELPEEAMKIVVDVLLAPMNNLSDEFIKLKIAAYPGRIYLGAIDRTKIDEIYLDLFKLYGSGDITRLEESGKDFTKRLLVERLNQFCKGGFEKFFGKNIDEVVLQLYNATLCNPRILGHILIYLHESHVSNQKLIGLRAVSDAARRFYEEKVESYFQVGRFLQEAFDERSSIFSLKELLESFVQRAKDLTRHDSAVFKKIQGSVPTSHFHVPAAHELLLQTLELNFFLTKYFEMSDRGSRKVAVYALNYGLCDKYSISFGRPIGEREFRLYFVERVFDYSALVLSYLKNNQEIVCETCDARFESGDLEKLQFYKMRCPVCESGICRVTNLSRKYENELKAVNQELLLPKTELGILQTLDSAGRSLRAGEIAEELDCSHQLVGWGAKHLEERGLVNREQTDEGRKYSATEIAKQNYFVESTQALEVK